MEVIILLAAGGVFALLLALNNLIKALTRARKVVFFDLLLVFLVTLIFVTAITLASLPDALPSPASSWSFVAALGVGTVSLLTIVIELFRPQRLRGSRGLMGMFSALLIALASVAIPFAGAYLEVMQLEPDADAVAVAPADAPTTALPSNANPTLIAAATAERASDIGGQVVALLRTAVEIVAQETEMSEIEVAMAVDDGVALSTLIRDSGGDVENVIRQITTLAQDTLRQAAARGDLNTIQAALFISQAETLIRLIVNNDVNTLGQRFSGEQPTLSPDEPTPTRALLVSLFTMTAPPRLSDDAATPTPAPPETTSPTFAATATPIPTNTRAAHTFTPEPTRTRFVFSTRTPTPTFTPVTPCLAETQYNLRLRVAPDYNAETLTTIPFATTIELFARGSASDSNFWWQAHYDDQEGWIDGAFVILGAACARLPITG